ncbi:MAG: hypothetical protein Q9163_000161, partial [Psora crenata]
MALARDALDETPTAPTLHEMMDEAEEGEDDALAFDTCQLATNGIVSYIFPKLSPLSLPLSITKDAFSLTSFPFGPPAHDSTLYGLREISSLASWTVSTHKPTCGTTALLAPTPHTFWQSDGPQPHLLTLHFFKLVKVVRLRIYLDFVLDESYTPTRMEFWAGWSSSYGLVQFAEWTGAEPRGWQEISLDGVGVRGR